MDFPITVWRYHVRLELHGTDRSSLPLCLEEEDLQMFETVPREDVYAQLQDGLFTFSASFEEPMARFCEDVSTLSVFLFQVVEGIEVAERYVAEERTDDARAWKVLANRGEWVKVPLDVEETQEGRFDVDPDRENEEVLRAHWREYPRWFKDGMSFKYPRLRDLE